MGFNSGFKGLIGRSKGEGTFKGLYVSFWVIPPASEFYMPTFRNTMFHLHRQVGEWWLNLRIVGVSIREGVVRFLLGNSPASEFYMPTFRNTMFYLHRQVGEQWLNLRIVGVSIREGVVRFLLGNSPASEFYMPTFRNTMFHLHRQVGE